MARVEVYMKSHCSYCTRVKRLLDSKQVDYQSHFVDFDPARRQEMIERSGGRRTMPQIFIDDSHVGDCDALMALERAGKLDALLAA